jgi:hypothetical protein
MCLTVQDVPPSFGLVYSKSIEKVLGFFRCDALIVTRKRDMDQKVVFQVSEQRDAFHYAGAAAINGKGQIIGVLSVYIWGYSAALAPEVFVTARKELEAGHVRAFRRARARERSAGAAH